MDQGHAAEYAADLSDKPKSRSERPVFVSHNSKSKSQKSKVIVVAKRLLKGSKDSPHRKKYENESESGSEGGGEGRSRSLINYISTLKIEEKKII